MRGIIDRLARGETLSAEEYQALLAGEGEYLYEQAREARSRIYGNAVFIRGLIEFTSCCKNDCYYCGLRRGHKSAGRYRLNDEQILACCEKGYKLGIRTFVLQGGEDTYYSDGILCGIVAKIKSEYPDCAVTLSAGERSRESYERLFEAGAERYLLRHEAANEAYYKEIHPPEMSFAARLRCLRDLKEIGYQVGCGFMAGAPGQTLKHIEEDLCFIKDFRPAMVGVGPFLACSGTPFAGYPPGELRLVLNILAILRLMNPHLLMPATTALAALDKRGRDCGLYAGANVIMPNLTPPEARKKYLLYDNKAGITLDSAEGWEDFNEQLKKQGYEIEVSRGDYCGI